MIVVFILILVWPGGEQEEPIVSATDSKQQDVISATAINELQDCESGYYKVIIDDKAFSSMSQATDTLRERANDSYFTDCLLYKPVSGAIVKGNGVRKIDNIYPGDEVSLDCQCLNDKKATVPVSPGVVEPAELIENTDINALEINKDTVFSNVVADTSANQDNQDTLKTE